MVAAWAERWGARNSLSALPRRNCLMVINYHRIGIAGASPFDTNVFSATPAEFDEQVAFLKKHFGIVTLAEAIAFARGETSWRGAAALLTFDDGYVDAYDTVFPILRSHGVQGSFFLPTSFIGTHRVPWWDAIAHQIFATDRKSLRLMYPKRFEFPLDSTRHGALKRMHSLYKHPATDPQRFLSALEQATGVEAPAVTPERLFMNWREAAEMVAGGMAIGSHTHSHELLSRMSWAQQLEDFRRSRNILEARLGVRVDTLAMPVGSRTSFSKFTPACLEESGYRAAFSFYGGVNLARKTNPFNICRIDGDLDEGHSMFVLKTQLAAAVGRTFR